MSTSSRCSSYEFAVSFRKIGLFCRVDVGIDPYKQAKRFSIIKWTLMFFVSLKSGTPGLLHYAYSIGWSCSPRRAASTVSGSFVKSATSERGFLKALSCPKGTK